MASYGHIFKPTPHSEPNITKGVLNSLGLREPTMKNITNLQKTLVKYMENNEIFNMKALYDWSIFYRDKDNNHVNKHWKYLIEMGKYEIELGPPLGTTREWEQPVQTPNNIINKRIKYLVWCIENGYTIMAKHFINKLHRPDSYYSSETLGKPLIAAINKRNMDLINDMLDNGTDPNVIGICGNPVLICMLNEELSIVNRRLWNNSIPIDNYFTEIIKLLIDKGADPNIKGHMGKTPLMIASEARNVEIVKHLLEKGADPKLKDNSGLSSIDIAKRVEHREIIRLLNHISIATKEIIEDLRFKNNAIPIKVTNEGKELINKSAIKVLGNKDLSELISKYGGKRRKCATKKTRRKKSMYKRKSKKRLSKSK